MIASLRLEHGEDEPGASIGAFGANVTRVIVREGHGLGLKERIAPPGGSEP